MGDKHAFRADWLDYNEGIFFVTICTHQHKYLFGTILNDEMKLNDFGKKVNEYLEDIPRHYPEAEIHNHIVMPNHVHILMQIVGARHVAPTENVGCLRPPMHGEPKMINHFNSRLAVIIGSFKAAVTKYARSVRARHVAPLPFDIWQTRFHDHYIRNKQAYELIDKYITTNPMNWKRDCFNN